MENAQNDPWSDVDTSGYAIRKLTPRECFRLMNFTEDSFNKAQKVNSNTQLYKEAGNAIVVSCLVAIFSQMGIGEKAWNDMTDAERYELIDRGTINEQNGDDRHP